MNKSRKHLIQTISGYMCITVNKRAQFNYPITYTMPDGVVIDDRSLEKIANYTDPKDMEDRIFMSGYLKVGANKIYTHQNAEYIVDMLIRDYGLKLEDE